MRLSIFAVALLALILPAVGHAAEPKQWVGRYPGETINGRDFWENLGAKLSRTMDRRLNRLVREHGGVEGPVWQSGDWIVAGTCKPHACDTDKLDVMVSFDGEVEVCVTVPEKTRSYTGTRPSTRSCEHSRILPAAAHR